MARRVETAMAGPGHSPYFANGGFAMAPQCLAPFPALSQSLPQSPNSSEGLSDDVCARQEEPPTSFPAHGCSSGGGPGSAYGEAVQRKKGRLSDKCGEEEKGGPLPAGSPRGGVSGLQGRRRGRPPGTGTKQQLASYGEWFSASAGMGFLPHAIEIPPGEDLTAKIMAFSQGGPRAICIISAIGVVSSVTLRQPDSYGGTVTYEGRFEILCLSGSYFMAEYGSSRNRAGGLSITLSSPDGRIIGGAVGGQLIAASLVQVIVGSFICGAGKVKRKQNPKAEFNPPKEVEGLLKEASPEEGSYPLGGAWLTSKEMGDGDGDNDDCRIDINESHN